MQTISLFEQMQIESAERQTFKFQNMNTTTLSPQKRFNQTITNPNTQNYLRDVLGENAREFVSALTTLANNNSALIKCEPMSLMYAAMNAPILGLSLDKNLGYAYVIPYKDKVSGKTLAQFQMGYKGFLQLALRSGQFRCINTTDVREGEFVRQDRLRGTITLQDVDNREERPIIGYAAFLELSNGFEKTIYMTKLEIEKYAKKYSQSYRYDRNKSSIWTTDFDAMAQKTVLKQLLSKFAPLSLEMQKAVSSDQAVFSDKENKGSFIDNDNNASISSQIANANVPSDDETAMLRQQYMQQVEQMEQAQIIEQTQEPAAPQATSIKRTRKSAARATQNEVANTDESANVITNTTEQSYENSAEQSGIIDEQITAIPTSNPELPFNN